MISILKQNGVPQQNVYEFVIDDKQELNKVPKAASHGSTCLVTKDGSVYVLNGQKEWVELTSSSSSSSSSTDLDKIQQYINAAVANAVIGSVDLPAATQTRLGLVKGSDEVRVAADGSLIIDNVSIEKIVLPNGMTVILDSGNSDY